MKNNLFSAILFLVFCLIITSCTRKTDTLNIELDDSVPLSLAPDVNWAVVTSPYASYKNEPDWNAASGGHCRKGDILMIQGKTSDKDTVWYKFADGWLTSDNFTVYSNRYKAISASNKLLENEK